MGTETDNKPSIPAIRIRLKMWENLKEKEEKAGRKGKENWTMAQTAAAELEWVLGKV